MEGGHHIPTETIIRRYVAGLKNFLHLYKSEIDYWRLIDNSGLEPDMIAEGGINQQEIIRDRNKWELIEKLVSDDTGKY